MSLSQGELYTFVTNKKGKGKKGSLVASIKGTSSSTILSVLEKLSLSDRKTVEEVTLDMAKNMEAAVKQSFPNATLVTDRFHVVKLAIEALQHLRIKHRWNELDKENDAIEQSKKQGGRYKPIVLPNGDTPKQLLARCRYVLAKKSSSWTENQKQRAALLFVEYPDLKLAYEHIMDFRSIYELRSKSDAKIRFEKWLDVSDQLNIKEFNTVSKSVKYNFEHILNFFNNRNTNANAESFNAKIKLFRANLRGVSDTSFFLFRLHKLFA